MYVRAISHGPLGGNDRRVLSGFQVAEAGYPDIARVLHWCCVISGRDGQSYVLRAEAAAIRIYSNGENWDTL